MGVRLVGWQVGRLVGRQGGWREIGRLAGSLVGREIGRLAGWLVGREIGRRLLAGWCMR